jgi:hypothetical protein
VEVIIVEVFALVVEYLEDNVITVLVVTPNLVMEFIQDQTGAEMFVAVRQGQPLPMVQLLPEYVLILVCLDGSILY